MYNVEERIMIKKFNFLSIVPPNQPATALRRAPVLVSNALVDIPKLPPSILAVLSHSEYTV
jgi:hypothetical protein